MALGLNTSIRNFTVLDPIVPYNPTTSFDFDGTNDFINLGNSWGLKGRATDTSDGTGLTCAAWFKLDDPQSAGTIDDIVCCISYPGGWSVKYQNTRLSVTMNYGGASRDANISVAGSFRTLGNPAIGTELRASHWHHVGMTWDGRYLKMYLNGALYGTTDAGSDDNYIHHDSGSPGTSTATQPACPDINDTDLLIGGDPQPISQGTIDGVSGICGLTGTATSSSAFNGLINEVAIYSKVISEDAFSEIFEAVNSSGSVLDLTKNYGDYTYSGSLVALYRGNNIDGTTATNVANPGTFDGSMKNSVGTSSTVPS